MRSFFFGVEGQQASLALAVLLALALLAVVASFA
jgi:hypothetical protein